MRRRGGGARTGAKAPDAPTCKVKGATSSRKFTQKAVELMGPLGYSAEVGIE
jgi:alkylation response protein AidB-like acyl-CoA dehydrogenase